MRLSKQANGITLMPETPFDKECLEYISDKVLTTRYDDTWHRSGPLVLTFKQHPWDCVEENK